MEWTCGTAGQWRGEDKKGESVMFEFTDEQETIRRSARECAHIDIAVNGLFKLSHFRS
jgi:hypothetical protein